MAYTPRGIRNNNPLNIRKGDKWLGLDEARTAQESSFCVFTQMTFGLRAAFKIIDKYIRPHDAGGYGLTTIRQIVQRWAPWADGNNCNNYARIVSNMTCCSPDVTCEFTPEFLHELVRAMAFVECGTALSYSDIQLGYLLFLHS